MAHKRGVGWRDEAAAGLMARTLSRVGVRGSLLVMLEVREEVAAAVRAAGGEPHVWHRVAAGGRTASSWPAGGPYDSATLRLPKAREELEMSLHAAAMSLRGGGRLWVYGANDEGARSAVEQIRQVMGSAATVATGGRCRVVETERPARMPKLRGTLERWRSEEDLDLPPLPARWVSYPGVFAHGRVDAGTLALVRSIPSLHPGARVLDFACGSGLLGAYVVARNPDVAVDFLDADAVALAAVEANVPGARRILSDGFSEAGNARYDLIVSNPPYHEGKEQTERILTDLVRAAPAHLTPEGTLLLVTQRRLPVRPHLETAFRAVRVILDEGPYRIWRAERKA